jgi:hypothetical protein
MTTLKLYEVHTDVLNPGRKITVSGASIINIDIEGTITKKTLGAGESFIFERYLIPIGLEITALAAVTVTEEADSSPNNPGEFLSAQVALETEHLSPNQYGGVYGTVYRQYHGAKLTTEVVAAVGITKLLNASGSYESTRTYSGDVDDGTDSIIITKGTDEVVFTIAGAGAFTCDSGWIDYVK